MLKTRTGDQSLVREINLSIILNALRDHSPISRAQLAAVTGLNKTTVSSLVQQLIEGRFVLDVGREKSEETGRPGRLLELNPAAGCIIGVEIGVDFISVLVTNFAVETIWRHQEHTTRQLGQEAILRGTLDLIHRAVAQTGGSCVAILGLGLGVPGLVDVTAGTLLFGPNLGWYDVPLRRMLEAEFAFPVYVDNEATMATLGESYFGVGRGATSVLYVSAGVGLGGGIVLNGHIISGADGFAGELGHMTLDRDGLSCNCGNRGCWETLVSQEALFRRIRAAVASGGTTDLLARTGGDLAALTVPLVVQAAEAGDRVALAALEETALYLGVGLANLVNVLNPEIIIFGGILSLASAFILPVVLRVLRERSLRWSLRSTRVLTAAYGFDACVMGGIATVYHEILSQPFKSVRPDGRRVSGNGRGARPAVAWELLARSVSPADFPV
jgi:glucokinase-like ROK family protein